MKREIRMYKLFLFSIVGVFGLLWGVIPPFLWAAPSISSISGTVSNGQTITIVGSGFGANGPTVLLFDDFEGGTNGNPLARNLAPLGAWSSVQSPAWTSYSNANKVSGNLAASFNIYNYPENLHPCIYANSSSNFDTFYVSWWSMIPAAENYPGYGNPAGQNWKVVWEWDNNDADVGIWGNGWDTWQILGNDYPDVYSQYFSYTEQAGLWTRWQFYNKGRTDATGREAVWTTDSLIGTVKAKDRNKATLNSGDTNKRHQIVINGYVRDTVNSHPTFDDVYIATGEYALARVEIGNNATYSRCTNLTILTPTLWSDTAITATVRQGSFANGSSAFLFVFDSNGGVNTTGYPITIGGPPPPAPPSGLRIIN